VSQGDQAETPTAEELAASIDTTKINKQRRYFLIGATAVVGGLGMVGAAVPFVASWKPSAKARALGAPVTVDFSKLRPGEMLGPVPAWRGQPDLHRLPHRRCHRPPRAENPELADPDSRNVEMQPSLRPEPLACQAPGDRYLRRTMHPPRLLAVLSRRGGTGAVRPKLAGRLLLPVPRVPLRPVRSRGRGVPAPDNLPVPPYHFLSETVVLIGEDEETA
jgi:ubiquinol-cytochrome c reductase iron-sulfur subunit